MKAKSIKGKSAEEIQSALEQSMADGFKPTLAIVFISISQDITPIRNLLDHYRIEIFGVTTAGEFIDGEVQEGSIVAMLLNLDLNYFKLTLAETKDGDYRGIGNRIGEYAKQGYSNPAFIVGIGGWGAEGEKCLRGIEEVTSDMISIFGAVAGDDNTGMGGFVFTNKEMTKTGIIALIIDADKVSLKGIATGGWIPIGIERTITKSKDNIVYTIENEPALDIFLKFLDEEISEINQGNRWMLKNNAFFPILIKQGNGSFVVRTGAWTDKNDRSVHFAGGVAQGSVFRFCQPPDFGVIDKVLSDANNEIRKNQMEEADALILFSCESRHIIFGPLIGDEIEGLKKLWKAPLAGFFSYGEIGRAKNGKNELHNTTCCFVALKEK